MTFLMLVFLLLFSKILSELKQGVDVHIENGHQCQHDKMEKLFPNKKGPDTINYVNYKNHPFYKRVKHPTKDDISILPNPLEELTNRRVITSSKCQVEDYSNIRVMLETGQLDLDSDKKAYLINKILPKAKQKISELLSVQTSDGLEITTSLSTCGFANILDEHKSPKVWDYDVLIYVTAENSGSCAEEGSTTLAFASSCVWDQFDKPIVGYINFCQSTLDPDSDYFEQINDVTVTIHEVFHALGYSSVSFNHYHYHDGTERSSTISSFSERDHTVSKIITETTLAVARWHFNCSTLNGMEIENGGGSGTAGSHPEMRIYQTDFMTGVLNANSVFSHITLAVMQDSGWYMANFQNADTLKWGKNQGCSFAVDNCIGDGTRIVNPENTFCITANQQRCTNGRRSIGICSIYTISSIPSYYQYFDESNYGGQEVNDFCPLYNQFSYSGSTRTSNCLNPNNADPYVENQFYGETYGPNSACFENNLRNSYVASLTGDIVGKCYKYSCLPDSILIYIDGGASGFPAEITCLKSEEGESKNPGGPWVGGIICPPFDELCPEQDDGFINTESCPNGCSGNGECKFPCTCECDEGWGSEDCSVHTCYGIAADDEDVCSGHGECTGVDTCECFSSWDGSNDCDSTTCFGVSSSNSDVCSGNGVCWMEDRCECDDGYIGEECQLEQTCDKGYNGDNCSDLVCYGKVVGIDSSVCNGGVCVEVMGGNHTCDCSSQSLKGEECYSNMCFGSYYGCNGNGECVETDLCLCKDGYFHADCSKWKCGGFLPDEEGVCNGRGTCIGGNKCSCEDDWTGSECQYSTCDGTPGTDPTVCSGNGVCDSTDHCECKTGYSGSNCENWNCYGTDSDDESVCNGQGECESYNYCVCNSGYVGLDCSGISCNNTCEYGCDYTKGECSAGGSNFFTFSVVLFFVIMIFLI